MSFYLLNDEDLSLTVANVKNCVQDIRTWMNSHMLKLNDDKTEVLFLATPSFCLEKSGSSHIDIGEVSIASTTCARNIGVIFVLVFFGIYCCIAPLIIL